MIPFSLFKHIALLKKYITRSSGYIGIVNSLMIFLIFLDQKGYNVQLMGNGIYIIIATLIIYLVIGYVDYRTVFPQEVDISEAKSSILTSLRKDVQDIKKKLGDNK